ncbi:4-phosphopantetheinyl transferase [Paucibacter sp. DJ1R-11]|uniref:4-phosphopantetheinyl transferase n=1 Tax=Paucibacter sp. DJ1R-11 TaxID=2893556 RepID=UPI0021E4A574|nr:4-phosphopantetheinyl transferase [Paucibacter sp. DJ1R-11]MCV2362595.1 4-phosphopantetheinyl transferase [Paucibacter sp. DJ1R-11]
MSEMAERGAPFSVCLWPACKPAPDQRVFVLALGGAASNRPEARTAARLAARQALAAQLGQPLDAVQLHAPPGQPPQVLGRPDIGLSFSHEAGLSLVAVNLDGPVGVDVACAEAPPDWAAVARDYLGPQAVALGAAGFAPAWVALEAQLKCCGQALTEWLPERDALLSAACRSRGLQLPSAWPGFVAALAVPRS